MAPSPAAYRSCGGIPARAPLHVASASKHDQEGQTPNDDSHVYERTRRFFGLTIDAGILHRVHEVVTSTHTAHWPECTLLAPLMGDIPSAVPGSTRVDFFAVMSICVDIV